LTITNTQVKDIGHRKLSTVVYHGGKCQSTHNMIEVCENIVPVVE